MLALAEIEERHDGGFFVLWRVAFDDFVDEAEIDVVEFEGDGWVVVGCIAVLEARSGPVCFYKELVYGFWDGVTYHCEGLAP